LFLVERDGKLIVLGAPLSAVNEQLKSADDPWLLWVRNYLGVRVEPSQKKFTGYSPFCRALAGGCRSRSRAPSNARHAADPQISLSFIIKGSCAPLMPGVRLQEPRSTLKL